MTPKDIIAKKKITGRQMMVLRAYFRIMQDTLSRGRSFSFAEDKNWMLYFVKTPIKDNTDFVPELTNLPGSIGYTYKLFLCYKKVKKSEIKPSKEFIDLFIKNFIGNNHNYEYQETCVN